MQWIEILKEDVEENYKSRRDEFKHYRSDFLEKMQLRRSWIQRMPEGVTVKEAVRAKSDAISRHTMAEDGTLLFTEVMTASFVEAAVITAVVEGTSWENIVANKSWNFVQAEFEVPKKTKMVIQPEIMSDEEGWEALDKDVPFADFVGNFAERVQDPEERPQLEKAVGDFLANTRLTAEYLRDYPYKDDVVDDIVFAQIGRDFQEPIPEDTADIPLFTPQMYGETMWMAIAAASVVLEVPWKTIVAALARNAVGETAPQVAELFSGTGLTVKSMTEGRTLHVVPQFVVGSAEEFSQIKNTAREMEAELYRAPALV
jgi:hypothetical protein